MNKKRNFFIVLGSVFVLSAAVLVAFSSNAISSEIPQKSNKYLEVETNVKNLAIKNFDINTNNVKIVLSSDVFNEKSSTVSADLGEKLVSALTILTEDKTFIPGDKVPVYFIEGNSIVSVAIMHADGTISLTKFDISKEEPVKIDHITKEVE